MFNNLKLKTKMLILLIVPMLVIMAGVNIYNYVGSKKALNEQIEQTAQYMTSSHAQKLELYFVDKEAIVNSAANSLKDENISEKAMLDYFKNLKLSSSGIVNVFAGFGDKKYLESNGWIPPSDYDPRTRDWYQKGMSSSELAYSDVYVDKGVNNLIVSIVKRIDRNGKPVGVVGVDINIDDIKALTEEVSFGKTGYAYVIDTKGNFISHPTLKPSDNIFTINDGEYKEAAKDFLSGEPIVQELTFDGVVRCDSSMPIGKTGWALVIDTPVSELYEGITQLGQVSAMSTVLGLILLGVIIFMLAERITKPISKLSQLVDRVANGDLTADISTLLKETANDEVGRLTRSFHTMTDNFIKIIEQLKESARELNIAGRNLNGTSQSATEIMQMICESIEEISSGMKTVSVSAEEITASSEEVTTSMKQLNNRAESGNYLAKEVGRRVKTLSRATEKTRDLSHKMYQDIEQRVAQVIEEVKVVEEIFVMTATISEIIEQTKLLSLIAAIETTKVEREDKGFVMVVKEVRKLVRKLMKIVANIQEKNKQVQQVIDDLVDNSRELLKFIGENVANDYDKCISFSEQYSDDADKFFGLTQEFSRMSKQVLVAMDDVNRTIESVADAMAGSANSTQEITKGTEYTTKSVMEINDSAHNLSKMAEELNKIVEHFKTS